MEQQRCLGLDSPQRSARPGNKKSKPGRV